MLTFEWPGSDSLVLPHVIDQVALCHKGQFAYVAFERLLTMVLNANVFGNTEIKKIHYKILLFFEVKVLRKP